MFISKAQFISHFFGWLPHSRLASGHQAKRSQEIDFLRGFALICIVLDHMQVSLLKGFTLQNYTLFDATELFVFLSGFSIALAYSKIALNHNEIQAKKRFLWRCVELYGAFWLTVIANNKILVVFCPALEKSIDEMKTLYQVHIASLKILMAEALGQSIESKKKQKGFIFFNQGMEFLPSGCAVLPAQLRSAGLTPIIYERKMPVTLEGLSFAHNTLHRFYFKGEYPQFAEAQRKVVANLKRGHCFYQPPMIIKDMEEMLLMQYNIDEFRLMDIH